MYTFSFNMGAFANEAQNKVIAAVESRFELQFKNEAESKVIVDMEVEN